MGRENGRRRKGKWKEEEGSDSFCIYIVFLIKVDYRYTLMAEAEHCSLWACAHHSHCSARWCQPHRAAFPAGAANCHSNHPRAEPPGMSLMKGRSCRAQTEQPSLFSSGLTGKLLEVQVSALHSITQFKLIPAFNSNHIATGSKGKAHPGSCQHSQSICKIQLYCS